MAERFHIPVAMWRVQLDLLGGTRRTAAITLGYGMMLLIGAFGMHTVMRRPPFPVFAAMALNFLGAIQGAILVFGGTSATHRAMLRDFDTKMLESHRITPMSNVSVALGYLFGANVQIMALGVIGLLFGAVLSFAGKLPVIDWVAGNLMAFAGAVMLWSVFVFAGLRQGKPFTPTPLVVVTTMMTMLILYLPGAGVFTGTYAYYLSWMLVTNNAKFDAPSVLLVAGLCVLLTCFWIHVAAVKYRRPDLPALNALRGGMLLLLWLVLGTLGIVAFDSVAGKMLRALNVGDELPRTQWIATILSSLLVALVPLAGAVQCRLLVGRGASPRDRWDTVSDLSVALAAALLVPLLMCTLGWSTWRDLPVSSGIAIGFLSPHVSAWAYTTAAVVLSVLTMRGLMTLCFARLKNPGVPLVLYAIVFWIAPVSADMAMAEMRGGLNSLGDLTALAGASPGGTVMVAWSGSAVPLAPGLAIQAGIAAVLTLLAARVRRARYLAGHCTRCGYDLTANTSGVCPECATPV